MEGCQSSNWAALRMRGTALIPPSRVQSPLPPPRLLYQLSYSTLKSYQPINCSDNKVTAMFDIYDEKIEQVITSKLHEHEAATLAAKRKMEAARNEMTEAEQAVEHWRFALQDYRKSHGLPPQPPNPSPVLEAEYSHMGPTELVEYWADNHGGEVIVKDLARVAMNAGMFAQYRLASSSIYAVLKRKPFKKVSPGCFQRIENTHSGNDRNIAIPLPAIVSFDDADDLYSKEESSYDNVRLR